MSISTLQTKNRVALRDHSPENGLQGLLDLFSQLAPRLELIL